MGFEIDAHPKYIQVFFIIWLFWRSQETILYKLCHTQYHYTSQSLFKSEEDCWPSPVMNLKLYSNPTTWRLESKAESTSCLEDTQNILLNRGNTAYMLIALLQNCFCTPSSQIFLLRRNFFLHKPGDILLRMWSWEIYFSNQFRQNIVLENCPW